jgi:hypothetical protein
VGSHTIKLITYNEESIAKLMIKNNLENLKQCILQAVSILDVRAAKLSSIYYTVLIK